MSLAPQAGLCEIITKCIQEGSAEAWGDLIRCVQPAFARVAYRVACEAGTAQPEEIDDIVQDALLKIAEPGCARLRKLPLDSDVTAMAYLKEMAINVARDYFRSRRAAKRGVGVTASLDALLAERVSEIASPPDADRQILLHQIDQCLKVDARERTVFWLYYRTGLTAREIAALPSIAVGAKGVESLLLRLAKSVRECLSAKGKRPGGAFQ